jgi:hypothetical protein
MSALFAKLNVKAHARILVIDAPASFEHELDALKGVAIERTAPPEDSFDFAIGFAVTQAELDRVSAALASATTGDAIVWVAYPKKTSKRYRCEFDRDSGWHTLGAAGFEPVRQVAIDDDWSALRFRRVEYIKTLKRAASMALSEEGRRRTREA